MEILIFAWLRSVAETTLNPDVHQSESIEKNIAQIQQWMPREKSSITQKFEQLANLHPHSLENRKEIIVHYNELIRLIDKLYNNLAKISEPSSALKDANVFLFSNLVELREILLNDFGELLNGLQMTALDQLDSAKAEFTLHRDEIKVKALQLHPTTDLPTLLTAELDQLLSKIEAHKNIQVGSIATVNGLIGEMNSGEVEENNLGPLSRLEELLIQYNLNSKAIIAYFKNWFNAGLAQRAVDHERLIYSYGIQELLSEIEEPEGLGFDRAKASLKEVLLDLLAKKIVVLEEREGRVRSINNPKDFEILDTSQFKVLCTLSSDQAGLILRAADDAKILIAKSLSAVFKTIVPFLSTKQKSDPSWQSMRSKSVSPEDRDKDIAIAALEEMIRKIKGY